MTTLQADALSMLHAWNPPTPDQDAVRRSYVSHLVNEPTGLSRDCFPDHVTASTLIVSADHRQVLLTLHAKAKAWFQMGGHCEAGDVTLAGAALREAREESGVEDLALDPVPVQLSPHDVPFCNPRGTVRHLDVRFVAVAPELAVHATSEESVDVAWWPVDALPTDEPNLLDLIDLARDRLAGSTQTGVGVAAEG